MHDVLDNVSQRPVVYLPNNSVRSSIDQHVHSETWLYQHCRSSPFALSAPSVAHIAFAMHSPFLRYSEGRHNFSCIHYLMNKTFNTVSDAVPRNKCFDLFFPSVRLRPKHEVITQRFMTGLVSTDSTTRAESLDRLAKSH